MHGRRAITEFAIALLILAAVAALPLGVTNDYWLGVLIVSMYFAMLASAWNLLAGYTGQFSLAPATFGMIGAYTTGLLAYHFGVPALLGTPAAIVAAGVIGLLLGRIVMRLRGPYLALTTLAFAEILRVVIGNSINVTRGDLGLSVPGLFDSRLAYYFLFVGVLALIQIGLFFLLRAPGGLYLQAIRDDEIAASSRGVDVVFWKTVSFALSSAVSGLAGALYAHFAQLISPELGLISQTGLVISMVVIGGMGSIPGSVIASFILGELESFGAVYLSYQYRDTFGLLLLILFLLFRPQGFFGQKGREV